MPKHGKNFTAAMAKIESHEYQIGDAISAIKGASFVKFDESVEVALNLGVDPRHADQMVRASVVLPHGTGKTSRIVVIAQGEKVKEAEDAGADHVGGQDLVEKIAGGWLEFEAVISTPDMMREVGKLGRVLGPRGLMPNPKTGTVTFDVAKAVDDIKAGKLDFRVDKNGVVHAPVGKVSFDEAQLNDNVMALFGAIMRSKPAASKGKYIKSAFLTSTMGPSVRIDPDAVEAAQV
ncbi:MAG: 50S ribosomal protein L1 [Acidobacteria bacterium]|nr:50S ribosomal protein L1 [Acidobacteriota bacterium]